MARPDGQLQTTTGLAQQTCWAFDNLNPWCIPVSKWSIYYGDATYCSCNRGVLATYSNGTVVHHYWSRIALFELWGLLLGCTSKHLFWDGKKPSTSHRTGIHSWRVWKRPWCPCLDTDTEVVRCLAQNSKPMTILWPMIFVDFPGGCLFHDRVQNTTPQDGPFSHTVQCSNGEHDDD